MEVFTYSLPSGTVLRQSLGVSSMFTREKGEGNGGTIRHNGSLKDESMGGGLKELIRKLMEVCSAPNVSDFFPILGGFDLQGQTKKALDLIGRISFTWADIIKERRERKGSIVSQEQDFLDVMIDNNFTDKQINQLLLELFSAGTDTSSSTIEWAMAELIKNPESMKKVQEELAREIKQDVDTLSTNGQKTPQSYNKYNKCWRCIAATTSVIFVTETTTRAGEARVAATSARDSSSKYASQAKEQTLDDLN
nr:(s)-n-methylcoclaurine 3'-hydroxylase isozyme 1 [Quercus suber]